MCGIDVDGRALNSDYLSKNQMDIDEAVRYEKSLMKTGVRGFFNKVAFCLAFGEDSFDVFITKRLEKKAERELRKAERICLRDLAPMHTIYKIPFVKNLDLPERKKLAHIQSLIPR